MQEFFSYERRVAFVDTDAMGVVHHANYLHYLEEARVAWMRERGLTFTHYPACDRILALLHYQVWHLKPALFDDMLRVVLQVRRDKLKIQFQYSIFKGEDMIAQAETLHIPVDRELKAVRPHAHLLKHMESEPWNETWLLNS